MTHPIQDGPAHGVSLARRRKIGRRWSRLAIDFDSMVVWNGAVYVPRDALDGYFRHEAGSGE